ncbi:hydroxymethylbilane synthase [Candidatus Nitrosocosmicus oleophilus]|uniref:hydroxymethylbilane synthase n=1 Tax=Candidatus Nitrosocosmicus oleophilus TaxID=1353260 RepID=UPI0018C965D6|nr:hydroxymethylbilane synthase [Candidatus Nitrosocosmicus oleophilus]
MKEIVVATRASKLATYQTNLVVSSLRETEPDLNIRMDKVTTKGDRDKRPFYVINQAGVFEKEVNERLLQYKADFAVHSLKDLHAGISDQLVIACIPKRERPNDVFINSINNKKLQELEAGSIIGTSSIRRAIQIRTKYPKLRVKSIRGNIETRLDKSTENHYSGIILAEAGIKRLGIKNQITQRLSIQSFTPVPGQGALAIVCRKDDKDLLKMLKRIEHKNSYKEIQAERSLTESIGAGCTVPMGALATLKNKEKLMTLFAVVYSLDGRKSIKVKKQYNAAYPRKLGQTVAEVLISKGAKEITKEWNNTSMNIDTLDELIE